MAIEVGFWRIDGQLRRVPFSPMKDEKSLEDLIARDLSIVEPDLLLIGRQVITSPQQVHRPACHGQQR